MKASIYYRQRGTHRSDPSPRVQRSARAGRVAARKAVCKACEHADPHGCKFTTEAANERRRLSGSSDCAKGMATPQRMYEMVLRGGVQHPRPGECKWAERDGEDED